MFYVIKERFMKRFYKGLALLSLCVLWASPCEAHTIVDDHKDMQIRAENTLKDTETYMQKKYHLHLADDMTIINTYEYEKTLKEYDLQDIQYAIEHSAAISVPTRNLIVINMNIVSPEAYEFFLTHELVHKYETEKSKYHTGLAEGIADVIAMDVRGVHLECKDQHIPYEDLTTGQDFQEAVEKYGELQVYEQCRYYARIHLEKEKEI